MREQRHWLALPVRFLAEIVVLVLLAAARGQLPASTSASAGSAGAGRPGDRAGRRAAARGPEAARRPAPPAGGRRAGVAARPMPARVAAAVQPLLRKRVLGRHVGVLVTDLDHRASAVPLGQPRSITPASTTKLLTSDGGARERSVRWSRFRTTVRYVPAHPPARARRWGRPVPGQLAATRRSPAIPTGPTSSRSRSRRPASCAAMKVARVRLGFDDSYFTGPAVNPAWPATYIPEDVVPPISSLWVDEGQRPRRLRLPPRPGRRRRERVRVGARGQPG